MARANRTWGEERIAAELLLKLGISVSPRTVRRYMKRPGPSGRGAQTHMWSTFLWNHAREVLACDFFVTVTARFRLVYVFVVLDISTRRLVHWNVTEHPTAQWTAQQFRTCVTGDDPFRDSRPRRHLLRRRRPSAEVDASPRPHDAGPRPTSQCLLRTADRYDSLRVCGFMIPLNERHLRRILAEWVPHYNRGRPHASLGPGIPDRPSSVAPPSTGHRLPPGHRVAATPILGGLHHEYRLEAAAA
jgi:putative transposase